MSPIISNKGLPLPQSSTSSASIPRPISPKTQAPSSSSLIMPASSVPTSSSATTSQAGSSGNLPPSSSNRLPMTILKQCDLTLLHAGLHYELASLGHLHNLHQHLRPCLHHRFLMFRRHCLQDWHLRRLWNKLRKKGELCGRNGHGKGDSLL